MSMFTCRLSPVLLAALLCVLGLAAGAGGVSVDTIERQSIKCPNGGRVRREINDLQQWQVNLWQYGIWKLRNTKGVVAVSLYDDFTTIHGQFTAQAHGGAYFLPWHRQFLFEFETQIRNIVPQSIPFWDWTKPIPGLGVNVDQFFTRDPIWNWMGGSSGGGPIPNPPFQNFDGNVPSYHLVSRAFVQDAQPAYTFVSRANLDVLTRFTPSDFFTFASYVEAIHGTPHVAVGNDMSLINQSPSDPLFYSHHAFIDKIWREWQVYGNNGNSFDGTHPSPTRTACLDCEPMQPFGRTVNQIFQQVQPCVKYLETSTRAPVFHPSSRMLISSVMRQTGSGDANLATDNGTILIPTQSEKVNLLSNVADSKINSPDGYIHHVVTAQNTKDSVVSSAQQTGMSDEAIAKFQTSFDVILLKLGVNVNDSVNITQNGFTAQDIAQQGIIEKQLLTNGTIPLAASDTGNVKNPNA